MTFIVVLVTLLIERFFDWSHLRQWGWYGAFERFAMQKIPGASPYLVLAGAILPLLIVVVIIDTVFAGVLFGFLLLVFQLVGLLYCYGPQNLWADSFASMNAVTQDDAQAASDKLKATFNATSDSSADSLHRQLVNNIFIASNQRIFAVIFWFVVLGLPGALLYRLINVATTSPAGAGVNAAARNIEMILDWAPVRVLAFIYALVGNFMHVLAIWRQRALLGPEGNELLLTECGMAAITMDANILPKDGTLEKNAVSLLDRVFIIVLIVVLVVAFIF